MQNHLYVRIILIITIVIISCSLESRAQEDRIVPISSGDGVIETTINNDAGWTANTWYELERDGYYTVMTPISNPSSRHIRIRAASGSGASPILRPYAGTSRCFAPTGDLTLKGIYVNAVDAAGTLKQNSVRTAGPGIRIVITECHFDRDLQSVLRVESANTRWFVTKTYISNLGLMADNNGRAWDDRGNNVDTVFFEDNIIYNLTGRMTRDGGGIVKYFYFNHNTFVNVFDRPFASGDAKEVYITNNLFVNTYFRGNDSLNTYQINTLPYTGEGVRTYRIHHNNFFITESLRAAYTTTFGPSGVVTEQPIFDSLSASLMIETGDNSLNTEMAVSFLVDPTPFIIKPMKDYWDNNIPVGEKATIYAGVDSGKGTWGVTHMDWDFRYSDTNPLYTAGTDGKPIGALFIWEDPDGVNENLYSYPAQFSLSQNYPNPFNPTTIIRYEIQKRAYVTLKVYDMLGQEVAALVDGQKDQGSHETSLYAVTLPSGTYYYALIVDGTVQTKKMILMK